ncbi:helix-turn-helix domain-containing protein [Virgibacillus proomii]|uniref:helix-turn-helix domain-containing protein n=1 Tax=Virgibacillus proomii TaxID=84407 RepID=UPI002481C360|nr:helix-turn-helix transcriptional regulator [Virgibacillus proomii]
MNDLNDIGKRLIELRKKQNLEQKEAAKLIGISSVNLSRYEKGNRTPNPEMLKKLAEFYNVKPSYIAFGEEDCHLKFLSDVTEEEAELLKAYLIKIRQARQQKE